MLPVSDFGPSYLTVAPPVTAAAWVWLAVLTMVGAPLLLSVLGLIAYGLTAGDPGPAGSR